MEDLFRKYKQINAPNGFISAACFPFFFCIALSFQTLENVVKIPATS